MYKHYIRLDSAGRVIKGFSDAFEQPQDRDICINDDGGYQFRFFPNGTENPPLMDYDGIPLYKYEGGAVAARSMDEIEADRAAIQQPVTIPSTQDIINANIMARLASLEGVSNV